MWHFGLFLGVKPRRSRPPLYIQGAGGRGHAGLTQRPRQSAGRWAKTPHCITETNNPFPRASRPPRCQHRSTAPSRCSSFHPHRVPSFQRCGGYMSSRQLIRRRDPVYLLCPGEKRAHEHEQARAAAGSQREERRPPHRGAFLPDERGPHGRGADRQQRKPGGHVGHRHGVAAL